MADYVVDTSIIIQLFVRDTNTEQSQRFFKNLITGDKFWIPEFCLVECTNVLWKQVRFHETPQTEAELLLVDLRDIPFTLVPSEELLVRALQIGVEHKLAVYDPVYIALAENIPIRLLLLMPNRKRQHAQSASPSSQSPISRFILRLQENKAYHGKF